MSLVGKKAPLINATAVINGEEIVQNFSFDQYSGKQYVVFFFYPKDFTFVCPTELHAFQESLSIFEELNTAVVACSTDSEHSHWAWLNTPKDRGGIQGITYPIIADLDKTISMNYGVLGGAYEYNDNGEMTFHGSPVAYRGLFLIDKKGIIRHELINDEPIGRSVTEAIRTVRAYQFYEKHGEVCPANWDEGQETLKETHDGVANYLSRH